MSKYFLAIMVLFLSSQFASSHPVAFQGSVGLMGQHSPMIAHNQVNYSFRYWWATGVHHFKRPNVDENRHATFVSSNFLLKRWNAPNFQANLYAVIGAGQSELVDISRPAGMGLVQFDIEDRKLYFLAKHLELFHEDGSDLRQSTVRLGLAPYLDDYDGIHSWLILEYQHTVFGELEKQDMLTPMLRIFYRNLLFEVGQSFQGMSQFNFTAHF